MNIGKNIKQLRLQKDLTQEQLAEKLGVSYQAVSKWENDANTPDISLLPEIASFFGVPIDTLFANEIPDISELFSFVKDDDKIRIVQMRGTKIISVSPTFSPDNPPIEIEFPRDCNEKTQYFKVEVHGHITTCGAINGDVICHQSILCHEINGDVKTDGNIKVNEINSNGNIVCNNIVDCYKINANRIECSGNITSSNIISNKTEQ